MQVLWKKGSVPSSQVQAIAQTHQSGECLALLGQGEYPDLALRWKKMNVPGSYLIGISSAIVLFIALPYGEELLRCLREPKEQKQLAA
jgi:hypothetical protein